MTTYGTIPSELPPSSNFILRVREQIRSGLGTRKQWKLMVKIQSINLPSDFNEFTQRIQINAGFFRVNYAIIVLFLLFLTLLWHPVSLIVFLMMMVAWLFFYFLRDNPVSIEGFVIDDRIVMVVLLLLTITTLLLTDVTHNIIIGLSIGSLVVLVHGTLRHTDDLFFSDDEENRSSLQGGVVVAVPLPLKSAAAPTHFES